MKPDRFGAAGRRGAGHQPHNKIFYHVRVDHERGVQVARAGAGSQDRVEDGRVGAEALVEKLLQQGEGPADVPGLGPRREKRGVRARVRRKPRVEELLKNLPLLRLGLALRRLPQLLIEVEHLRVYLCGGKPYRLRRRRI